MSTVIALARMTMTFGVIAAWILLFLVVFFGLYSLPMMMMAGFILLYVAYSYVRHRRRAP
jgi:hypothetical protein